jgi:type VI secretion system secreted protein Hcp
MSSDFFVKIAKADGESKRDGKEKQIEIHSWSWGLTNASGVSSGGGMGKGKGTPNDLTFSYDFDKSGPNLIKFGAAGDHIDELKLTARKAGGTAQDYIIITLTQAFVTSVNIGGSAGGEVVMTVSCTFKKIKFEYFEQDAKGGVKPGPLVTWDVETGKAEN